MEGRPVAFRVVRRRPVLLHRALYLACQGLHDTHHAWLNSDAGSEKKLHCANSHALLKNTTVWAFATPMPQFLSVKMRVAGTTRRLWPPSRLSIPGSPSFRPRRPPPPFSHAQAPCDERLWRACALRDALT